VYACEYSGKRLHEIAATRKNGKLMLSLDNSAEGGVILLYELVGESGTALR
jgi:hypothetical protein